MGAARCVADGLPAVGRRVRQAAHVHRSHGRISQHIGRQAEGEAGDLGEPVVSAGVVIAAQATTNQCRKRPIDETLSRVTHLKPSPYQRVSMNGYISM